MQLLLKVEVKGYYTNHDADIYEPK